MRIRAMEDEKIIELYWNRDQGAIRHTAEKYGSYCGRIAKNILLNIVPQNILYLHIRSGYSDKRLAITMINGFYLDSHVSVPDNFPRSAVTGHAPYH